MKSVLITGGSGFVGRYYAEHFIKNNWIVDVVDINKIKHSHYTNFFQTDCRDFFKLKNPTYDIIIHLAAVVGGRQNLESNQISVAIDLSLDADFFNWVTRCPEETKIIYYSSSAAYPVSLQKEAYTLKESDIDLDNIKNPDMTYGWVKLTGEMLAQKLHKEYGKRISVFRPFSGYGVHQDETYPFPAIMKRIFNKENPITIWGNGGQVRDFINIRDVVAGSLHLSNIVYDGSAINLSTGIPTSFTDLVQAAYKLVWNDAPEIKCDSDKPQGPFYRCGDISLQEKYGFKYKISLEESILEYMNFLREKK